MALASQVPTRRSKTAFGHGFMRQPEAVTLGLILALVVIVSAINPSFLQLRTLFDLLRSTITLGIFALGVLLVLAAGGIDVSFTAIAVFSYYCATVIVLGVAPNAPFVIPLLISSGLGLLLGLLNGLIVDRFNAPSLIVTIGTQYLIRGALLAFIGTRHIMDIPTAMEAFGRWNLIQYTSSDDVQITLPMAIVALVLIAASTWWLLNRALMGRAVYAVGNSPSIASRLGIRVQTVYLFVFGYAGLLAGLGGMLHASMGRQANPFDLVGSELDVIAAVVLGGARVTGGTGTVHGTLLGVVLVVLINNTLILMGVPSTWQKVVIGAIILFASGIFARRKTS